MKVIIGLGNPGKAYESTYHNVGFIALDEYAKSIGAQFSKNKYNALIAEARVADENIILVKPQTFMNNSGVSVVEIVKHLKIELKDVLVVYDDIDVEMGLVRLKPSGSAGTHNGMKSIVQHLHTTNFPRLRIGIKAPYFDLASFVLSKIKPDNTAILSGINLAKKIIEMFVSTNGDVKEINEKKLIELLNNNKVL